MAKRNIIHNFGHKLPPPMPKRIYYEDTQTTVTQKKGWIEVDTDFTQVYDCFSKISVKLKSITSVKLLFWLLSHEANKSNGINSGKSVYERFIKYLEAEGVEAVTERTFQNCFEELRSIEVITKVGRGQFYFNPYLFWRDDKSERVNFIVDEAKEKKHLSHNPIKQLTNKK